MKNVRWLVMLAMVLGIGILACGCSGFMYKNNQNYVARQTAYKMYKSDPQLFKAYVTEDYVGLGIDISKLNVVTYDWRTLTTQAAAAVADGAALYFAIDAMSGSGGNGGDNSSASGDAGRDRNDIDIRGDGNVVTVGDRTENQAAQ